MFRIAKIVVAAVVIAAGVGIWYAANKTKPVEKQPVKIGAILPLSGEFSFIGQEMQRGMELARAEHPDTNLKIIYEDDQTFDAKTSVNALNKLLNTDKVNLVLNDGTNTVKALAPVLNSRQIPGVVIWDSNIVLTTLGDYVFGMGLSTEHAGSDMAEYAYRKLGIKHLTVVSFFDEWSDIISKAFVERFSVLGGKVDFHEKVKLDEIDLRTILLKVNNAHSQALYFPLNPPVLNNFIKQAKEAAFPGYLLTGDGFTDSTIKALGDLAEGVYAAQPWLEDPVFLKKYQNKYGPGVTPSSLAFAGLGYDAATMVAELVKKTKGQGEEITADNLRQNLVDLKSPGVFGETAFLANRIADKREKILLVKNGAFVQAEK